MTIEIDARSWLNAISSGESGLIRLADAGHIYMTLCSNCHTVTINPEMGDLCEACADIIWNRPSLEVPQRNNKEARQLRNRALDIAGIGLYRLSTSDRASLIRFAKCRSFAQLEDMPRREQIDVIARWLEAKAADLFGAV